MEPRLLRRGNERVLDKCVHRDGLQWSHAFSDVETVLPPEVIF